MRMSNSFCSRSASDRARTPIAPPGSPLTRNTRTIGFTANLCGLSEEFPVNLHGLLGDRIPRKIVDTFSGRGSKLGRPSAILMQGAHMLGQLELADQIFEQQPIDSVLNEF